MVFTVRLGVVLGIAFELFVPILKNLQTQVHYQKNFEIAHRGKISTAQR